MYLEDCLRSSKSLFISTINILYINNQYPLQLYDSLSTTSRSVIISSYAVNLTDNMQLFILINFVALFVALVSATVPNPLYRGSGSSPEDVKRSGGFRADVACPAGGCTAETVYDHTLDILKPKDPLISTTVRV
jgi:hypothetical protein